MQHDADKPPALEEIKNNGSCVEGSRSWLLQSRGRYNMLSEIQNLFCYLNGMINIISLMKFENEIVDDDDDDDDDVDNNGDENHDHDDHEDGGDKWVGGITDNNNENEHHVGLISISCAESCLRNRCNNSAYWVTIAMGNACDSRTDPQQMPLFRYISTSVLMT